MWYEALVINNMKDIIYSDIPIIIVYLINFLL